MPNSINRIVIILGSRDDNIFADTAIGGDIIYNPIACVHNFCKSLKWKTCLGLFDSWIEG